MPSQDIPLSRSMEAKLAWAEACYKEKGDMLLRDERTAALLSQLREAVHASRTAIVASGVADECRICEEREGGSCCGAGVEDKYDHTLLLINLLLGIQLPKQRLNRPSCLFLGPDGCLLMARQVICINYLCKKIENRVEPSKITALRAKEGVELEYLFLLNERIKEQLKDYFASFPLP